MYKSLKYSKGLSSIAALLVTITFTSLFVIYYSQHVQQQRINQDAEKFYERLVYYRDVIHAYASDRYQAGWGINTQSIFPASFSDLEGVYIPTCSVNDNDNGLCQRYNQTPLGVIPDANYSVVAVPNAANPTHYRAEIVINLPDKANGLLTSERQAVLQYASQTPNVVYDDVNNTITLRVDRPDKAFAYDSLVKRSGDDSELLGDWDIGGNYALTNARDYTIRNSDGTQKTVANKLTEIYTVRHGDYLTKPSCPSGMAFSYNLSISGIDSAAGYTLTGSNRPYLLSETSNQIRVGLDIIAERNTDKAKVMLHSGYVTVFMQCT